MRKWFVTLYEFLALPGRRIAKLEMENRLLQRELDTARLTAQNAITKATDFQDKMNEALRRDSASSLDHIQTLKTLTNAVVIKSGGIKMFDEAGPAVPVPKHTDNEEPFSTRRRAREAVNDITKRFTPDPAFDLEEFIKSQEDHLPSPEEVPQ